MSTKKTKGLILLGAVILFVLLLIAPKINSNSSQESEKNLNSEKSGISKTGNLNVYLDVAIKNLIPIKKDIFLRYKASKNYDSSLIFWDKLKKPDIASYFAEKLAENNNTSENWLKAGNRYYYAIPFCEDATEQPILYQCALRCFSKSLELNQKNTEAKIMIASCYVEGSQDPMVGIKKLKEIEKTDSNNLKLQLTFAFFSVKSGQFNKAIDRFIKVLRVDSNYVEAYLHLANAYEQQNKPLKAIEMLEKYYLKIDDLTTKIEINKYIEQLKITTNH